MDQVGQSAARRSVHGSALRKLNIAILQITQAAGIVFAVGWRLLPEIAAPDDGN
jgi:hypothetical protein